MEEELKKLTNEELNELYAGTSEYMTFKKSFIMILLILVVPTIGLMLYNGYNQRLFYFILVIAFVVSMIRKISKNKILWFIFTPLFGILYCLILLANNIMLSYSVIFVVVILYVIGARIFKKNLMMNYIINNIKKKKNKKNNNVALIILSATIPLIIGDNLQVKILIVTCFILSMVAVSNLFNPYYYEEQINEQKKRLIKKQL